jgi:F-type H+-transporting ATPase subunit gamma
MAGIRELRARIKSVGNIKQITRAMEMVATTKLRRFQDRAVSSRPYTAEITSLVGRLAAVLGEGVADLPLFRRGEGDRVAVLLVSSDRGLCGAYNSNLFRVLELWMRDPANGIDVDQVDFFVYGKKGYQYLTKRDRNVERYLVDPPLEEVDFANAAFASRVLLQAFLSGKYKEVKVLYTTFETMVRYTPKLVPFLPVGADALGADGELAPAGGDLLMEPDAATIFDQLIPRYLETRVYNALLEALTSEYASRRFSMKNATDAASDMQAELQMVYNRKRQETVTKELLDIVGGAEAVK